MPAQHEPAYPASDGPPATRVTPQRRAHVTALPDGAPTFLHSVRTLLATRPQGKAVLPWLIAALDDRGVICPSGRPTFLKLMEVPGYLFVDTSKDPVEVVAESLDGGVTASAPAAATIAASTPATTAATAATPASASPQASLAATATATGEGTRAVADELSAAIDKALTFSGGRLSLSQLVHQLRAVGARCPDPAHAHVHVSGEIKPGCLRTLFRQHINCEGTREVALLGKLPPIKLKQGFVALRQPRPPPDGTQALHYTMAVLAGVMRGNRATKWAKEKHAPDAVFCLAAAAARKILKSAAGVSSVPQTARLTKAVQRHGAQYGITCHRNHEKSISEYRLTEPTDPRTPPRAAPRPATDAEPEPGIAAASTSPASAAAHSVVSDRSDAGAPTQPAAAPSSAAPRCADDHASALATTAAAASSSTVTAATAATAAVSSPRASVQA